MAQLRIPAEAKDLLPFCRPSEECDDRPCFETYAELLTFAACLAFRERGAEKPVPCKSFLTSPSPVDLAVFKNQRLYPHLLALALAVTQNHSVSIRDEDLARLIEDYAQVGCHILVRRLANTTPSEFHADLARLITEPPEMGEEAKF